jgi:hypothetical protein
MCATRLTHHIFLDFIFLVMFDEENKLHSTSLCNFLQASAILSLFGTDTVLMFSRIRSVHNTSFFLQSYTHNMFRMLLLTFYYTSNILHIIMLQYMRMLKFVKLRLQSRNNCYHIHLYFK